MVLQSRSIPPIQPRPSLFRKLGTAALAQLADGYRQEGDWQWLTEDRERWIQLLREMLGWRGGKRDGPRPDRQVGGGAGERGMRQCAIGERHCNSRLFKQAFVMGHSIVNLSITDCLCADIFISAEFAPAWLLAQPVD